MKFGGVKEERYLDSRNLNRFSAWHLASYPRSGNHLVRAILEAYTNRPTEGCLGSTNDTPIYQRSPNKSGVIQIKDTKPIAYKAHWLREIHARERVFGCGAMGMILITRDPAQAISSHIARSKKLRLLPQKRRIRRAIGKAVDEYLGLVHRYAAHQCSAKFHVQFEDLINVKTAHETATSILKRIGVEMEGPSLQSVAALAKESQQSIGGRELAFKSELQSEVGRMLSYEEVLAYIDS